MSPIAACGDSAPAIAKDSARRLPGPALERRGSAPASALAGGPTLSQRPSAAGAPPDYRTVAPAAALRFELPEVTGLNTPEDRNPFNHGEIM
jgi:hypothetical protein